MAAYVDLHLHTSCSDGVCTPAEVLEEVRYRKLAAFAITDHDSFEGYRIARELVSDSDPELISGVELSVSGEVADVHILAYLVDVDNPEMNRAIKDFQTNRNQRGHQMVEKLNALGFDITYDDVLECAGDAAIGRPHVAKAMEKKKNVKTYEEAFARFLGTGKPAYVPKVNLAAEEAIAIIHGAGGAAILAHPVIDEAYKLIDKLKAMGLDGVEAWHPSHRQADCDRFKSQAQEQGLLVTGGSDFHGIVERHGIVGSQKVPYNTVVQLKKHCQEKRNQF